MQTDCLPRTTVQVFGRLGSKHVIGKQRPRRTRTIIAPRLTILRQERYKWVSYGLRIGYELLSIGDWLYLSQDDE